MNLLMTFLVLWFVIPEPTTNAAPLTYCSFQDSPTTYPDTWFAPVDPNTAYDWEILPQEAKPGEVILSKRNELGILSNFAATPFTLDGTTYASLEGFWQMMKFPESPEDPRWFVADFSWTLTRSVVGQMVAFEARHAGDQGSTAMKKLGINYVTYRNKAMVYRTPSCDDHCRLIVRATRAKLEQNPRVKEILCKTGSLILRPDHKPEPNQPPAWNYFNIWMALRAELQQKP
jgi:hypothetical protein